jgi:hypothetical protein
MTARTHPRGQGSEQGVALALAIFVMAALAVGATSALFVGSDDIQASRGYRGAAQAHFAAESGLSHAVQNINAVGIVDFEQQVVDNWDDWLGSAALPFPALTGFTYEVEPLADATNPAQVGWLRATANGPENVRNVTVARVQQSSIPGTAPGAIYLANDDPTNSNFVGNNFLVDGNDHFINGTPNPAGEANPGIATRNDTNTQEAAGSLNPANQLDNIQGLGYQAGPPIVPSIQTAPSAANASQLNALADALASQPGVYDSDTTQINNSNKTLFQSPTCYIGCCDGVTNSPKISHFTADSLVMKFNGNITGCGIMIVDGDLSIQGTIDFLGLIIVRGYTTIEPSSDLGIIGNATVYGSLWTSNLDLNVGGSAVVKYSSQALAFANEVISSGAFPAPINVLALVNCAQVPAGTAGCP